MGTKKNVSVKVMLAIGTAVAALAIAACAPEPGGPAEPTTSTTTTSTMPWSEPVGVWTPFNMTCSANVAGTDYPFLQPASVNVEAPALVNQGDSFFATVAPGPFVVPANVQGFDVTSMSAVAIRFPISPNAQFQDSVLSAGLLIGTGIPSVKIEGNFLVYRVPGPLAAGATIQMPKVRVKFKATGAPGSTIEFRMTNMTAVAKVGVFDIPNNCTPNSPNPLFWSTSITSAS